MVPSQGWGLLLCGCGQWSCHCLSDSGRASFEWLPSERTPAISTFCTPLPTSPALIRVEALERRSLQQPCKAQLGRLGGETGSNESSDLGLNPSSLGSDSPNLNQPRNLLPAGFPQHRLLRGLHEILHGGPQTPAQGCYYKSGAPSSEPEGCPPGVDTPARDTADLGLFAPRTLARTHLGSESKIHCPRYCGCPSARGRRRFRGCSGRRPQRGWRWRPGGGGTAEAAAVVGPRRGAGTQPWTGASSLRLRLGRGRRLGLGAHWAETPGQGRQVPPEPGPAPGARPRPWSQAQAHARGSAPPPPFSGSSKPQPWQVRNQGGEGLGLRPEMGQGPGREGSSGS